MTTNAPLDWSEEILREMFRHTPIGVVLHDLHGTIFDVNEAACALVGYPRELVVGRAVTAFMHPEEKAQTLEILSHLRDGDEGSRRIRHRLLSRGGKSIFVSTTVWVVRSRDEGICGIAFIEDIGDRMRMQAALRDSESLYRQVVEDQTEMIVRVGPAGVRSFANQAYARFFGLDPSDLVGTPALPLIAEEDRATWLANLDATAQTPPPEIQMLRVVAGDGSIRWTEWTNHALFGVDGKLSVLQSIGRDVTERVQAVESLRLSETRFRRLFDDLPVAAFESDWTALVALIRANGLKTAEDFVEAARTRPEFVSAAFDSLGLVEVNSAAFRFAGVADKAAFAVWRSSAFAPESLLVIIHAVAKVIVEGRQTQQVEMTVRIASGEPRRILFQWCRVPAAGNEWRVISTIIDLTEHEAMEAALRRSEEMYRQLFHNLPVAVWETDWSAPLAAWRRAGITSATELVDRFGAPGVEEFVAERKLVEVNANALAMYGLADAAEFAAGAWSSVHPDHLDAYALAFARVLYGEAQVVRLDSQALDMSGRVIDVELTLAPNPAFPGRIMSTAVDVSARKQIERELQSSESMYRLLFNNLPVAVWEADWSNGLRLWQEAGIETAAGVVDWLRNGDRTPAELAELRVLREANQNAVRLAGAQNMAEFRQWLLTVVRPEDIARVVPEIASVLLGLEKSTTAELRTERLDGAMIDLEMQFAVQEGSPGRIITMAIDTTEKKRIERELLHSQALLERAQAIAHIGSWEASLDRDEVFGSKEYWRIIDGHEEGPSQRPLSETLLAFHPDDRAMVMSEIQRARDAYLAGTTWPESVIEFRVVRPDGVRLVHGQGHFSLTPDGDPRIYGILRDVTEQRRAEEAAQKQREELTRADRMISLGVLVSGVAHEINNPNHLIMLNAPLLQQAWNDVARIVEAHAAEHEALRIGNLPWSEMRDEVPEVIAEIIESSERIRAIVSELRGFGRDQHAAERRPEDLNDIVRGSLRLLANHIRKATTRFELDLANEPLPVEANARRLEQVIVNLVLNSCQAVRTPDALIRVSTGLDRASGRAEIRVRDEGGGIPAADLLKIRDPFFTTKRAEGGMGLGLAVSDRIVGEHNGSLAFESVEGAGTTAVVSIPSPVRE